MPIVDADMAVKVEAVRGFAVSNTANAGEALDALCEALVLICKELGVSEDCCVKNIADNFAAPHEFEVAH